MMMMMWGMWRPTTWGWMSALASAVPGLAGLDECVCVSVMMIEVERESPNNIHQTVSPSIDHIGEIDGPESAFDD